MNLYLQIINNIQIRILVHWIDTVKMQFVEKYTHQVQSLYWRLLHFLG